MFKKNPTRPVINISLKKTSQGYRVVPNEAFQLFTTKKIIRSIYRPDLIQMSAQHVEGVANNGALTSGTIIQPPSHVTLPAVSSWFREDSIHQIQRQHFPEYFRQEIQNDIFSFSVKNANLYQYYRNSMIFMWRENAKKYLSPSLCRKNLLGDVSSIMRIHAFLENWGLINFPSKQHNKGLMVEKPQNMNCYVCEVSDSRTYYVTEIEEVFFQICQGCFDSDFYPQCIKKAQFTKVLSKNHLNNQKQMDRGQIARMLEIVNGIPNGAPRDKDSNPWSIIQKEFPQLSKEKILKNFLKIPITIDMHSNIFENNQDFVTIQNQLVKKQIELVKQPSIFEDFENPIMGSIAYMYYAMSKAKGLQQSNEDDMMKEQEETLKIEEMEDFKHNQELEFYKNLIEATVQHSKVLCQDQEGKIRDLTKMLIEVVLSRLELKSLFISEYENLLSAQEQVVRNVVKNNLAEGLKINLKFIEIQNNTEGIPKEQALDQESKMAIFSPKKQKYYNQEIWNDDDLDL